MTWKVGGAGKKDLNELIWGLSMAAIGRRRRPALYKYSSLGYSLLVMHKSTAVTDSAVDGILETVSKPHPSVKEVLPVLEIGIIALFLKSF